MNKEEIKILKTTAKKWAKINLAGKNYSSPIGSISVTMGGVREILDQPHHYQVEKIQAIYSIDKLLMESEFVKTSMDKMGRPFLWYYLKIVIAENYSYIVVREDIQTGNKLLYSIVDYIK